MPAWQPGFFNINMDFATTILEKPRCMCCGSPPSMGVKSSELANQAMRHLPIYADPREVFSSGAPGVDTAPALRRIFGDEGLSTIFGCSTVTGAYTIHRGGLNHVFMIAHGRRLIKFTRPLSCHHSEAREAERLRHSCPGLAEDPHAMFPLASFICQPAADDMNVNLTSQPFEIMVFDYLEGCQSLGEIIRTFEKTHTMGTLRCSAACTEHRNGQNCRHVQQMNSLMAQQVPFLNRRFQSLYNRRHGDLKADNVLIERSGNVRLADFLNPFCTSCDWDEFMRSTVSTNPVMAEIRENFGQIWQSLSPHVPAQANRQALGPEVSQNVDFVHSLSALSATGPASYPMFTNPSPPLFGSFAFTFPIAISVPL